MRQAPPTPQVQRSHKPGKQHIPAPPIQPLPAVSKPPVNPPNISNKSAAKATTSKSKNHPPPPGFQSGVPPPVPQFPQPQYPAGQSGTPFHQQPPRPPSYPAQISGNVVAPHQQGPVHNAAVSGQPPPFHTLPPAAETANQLKRLREHYSQPQFQTTAKWGVPAAPQGIDPYPPPITGNQVPNHMNQYLISSNAEAQAKYEKAQREAAAANVAYEQAMERLAALQAKGPNVPPAQAPSSHHRAASAKPHVSVIEELEHNAREAARKADEAARVAGIKTRGEWSCGIASVKTQFLTGRAPKRVSVAPGHFEIPPFQPAHVRGDNTDEEESSQEHYRNWRQRQDREHQNRQNRSQSHASRRQGERGSRSVDGHDRYQGSREHSYDSQYERGRPDGRHAGRGEVYDEYPTYYGNSRYDHYSPRPRFHRRGNDSHPYYDERDHPPRDDGYDRRDERRHGYGHDRY